MRRIILFITLLFIPFSLTNCQRLSRHNLKMNMEGSIDSLKVNHKRSFHHQPSFGEKAGQWLKNSYLGSWALGAFIAANLIGSAESDHTGVTSNIFTLGTDESEIFPIGTGIVSKLLNNTISAQLLDPDSGNIVSAVIKLDKFVNVFSAYSLGKPGVDLYGTNTVQLGGGCELITTSGDDLQMGYFTKVCDGTTIAWSKKYQNTFRGEIIKCLKNGICAGHVRSNNDRDTYVFKIDLNSGNLASNLVRVFDYFKFHTLKDITMTLDGNAVLVFSTNNQNDMFETKERGGVVKIDASDPDLNPMWMTSLDPQNAGVEYLIPTKIREEPLSNRLCITAYTNNDDDDVNKDDVIGIFVELDENGGLIDQSRFKSKIGGRKTKLTGLTVIDGIVYIIGDTNALAADSTGRSTLLLKYDPTKSDVENVYAFNADEPLEGVDISSHDDTHVHILANTPTTSVIMTSYFNDSSPGCQNNINNVTNLFQFLSHSNTVKVGGNILTMKFAPVIVDSNLELKNITDRINTDLICQIEPQNLICTDSDRTKEPTGTPTESSPPTLGPTPGPTDSPTDSPTLHPVVPVPFGAGSGKDSTKEFYEDPTFIYGAGGGFLGCITIAALAVLIKRKKAKQAIANRDLNLTERGVNNEQGQLLIDDDNQNTTKLESSESGAPDKPKEIELIETTGHPNDVTKPETLGDDAVEINQEFDEEEVLNTDGQIKDNSRGSEENEVSDEKNSQDDNIFRLTIE